MRIESKVIWEVSFPDTTVVMRFLFKPNKEAIRLVMMRLVHNHRLFMMLESQIEAEHYVITSGEVWSLITGA